MSQLCQPSLRWALLLLIAFTSSASAAAEEASLSANLAILRAVAPLATGHRQAVAAARAASQAPAGELPVILAAMDGVNPVAENWIRGVAEAVAQHAAERGEKLPHAELEGFLAETKHSPRARRLAYELIATVDPSAETRLIPTLLDDPSVELRRDAVAQVLAEAAKIADANKEAATKKYAKAFHHAREIGRASCRERV